MSKGAILIVVAAIFWGLTPLIYNVAGSFGFDAISVAAMRAYSASIVFIIYGVWKKELRKVAMKHMPFYALYGIFSIGGMSLFYSLSIKTIPAAMVTILLYTAPAFVIIFSKIFYNETITINKMVSLILTFIGCGLVIQLYSPNVISFNIIGIAFGILSGLCYAGLTLFGKVGLKLYSPQINTIMPTLFSSMMYLFISSPLQLNLDTPQKWVFFFSIGITLSVIPFFLYLKGMELGIEGGKASLIAYIEPVTAAIVGFVFLREQLELLQILGILIVILGAYIVVRNGDEKGQNQQICKEKLEV